jgi:phasin family protein
MLTVEQLAAAQKTAVGNVFAIAAKALEGVEKLAQLNLQAGKTSLTEAQESAQSLFDAKDASTLFAFQTAALQPNADKFQAYGRQVYDIVSATNAEIARVIEESAAEARNTWTATLEQAAKNAPAGTDNAVAFMKQAVAAASSAYDTIQKAVKQAADVAEANVEAVSGTVAKTTGSSRAKRGS